MMSTYINIIKNSTIIIHENYGTIIPNHVIEQICDVYDFKRIVLDHMSCIRLRYYIDEWERLEVDYDRPIIKYKVNDKKDINYISIVDRYMNHIMIKVAPVPKNRICHIDKIYCGVLNNTSTHVRYKKISENYITYYIE